jgi:hypothetical protein
MTLVNGYLPFPANIPDTVILALMRNANTLEMVLDYALVNRQFFRVFKDNELYLLKIAMFHMSHPAWELREMSPPWSEECYRLQDSDTSAPEYTPTLHLRHNARAIDILVKLKFWSWHAAGNSSVRRLLTVWRVRMKIVLLRLMTHIGASGHFVAFSGLGRTLRWISPAK